MFKDVKIRIVVQILEFKNTFNLKRFFTLKKFNLIIKNEFYNLYSKDCMFKIS